MLEEKGTINARGSQNNEGMVDPSHQKLKQTLWENKAGESSVKYLVRGGGQRRSKLNLALIHIFLTRAVSEGVRGSIPGMEPGLPRGKDHM
ncbi:hypothetical protein Tco_0502562, partial [Tanacetum coccineum]